MRWGGTFDYENKKELLEETVRELEDPEVWNDPERARKLGKNRTSYENVVLSVDSLSTQLADANELLEMAESEDD